MLGRSGRSLQLDGLRFLAILPVLIGHLWKPGALPWIFAQVEPGMVGVRTFFVLSGFLITGVLLRDLPSRASMVRLSVVKNFQIRRQLRIAPVYFACVAAVVLVWHVQYGAVWLWPATFTTNFYILLHGQWPGCLAPLWSVAVQEQFYLVWPFVILFCPRRLVFAALGTLLVAAPLFRYWATYHWGIEQHVLPGYEHVLPGYVQTAPLAVCDSLAIGGIVALLAKSGALSRRRIRVTGAAAGGLLLLMLGLSHYGVGVRLEVSFSETAYDVLLGLGVYVLAVGVRGPVGWLLQSYPLVYLGQITYGIYLFHMPMAQAFTALSLHVSVPYGYQGFLFFLVVTAATIVTAAASWHLVEKPIDGLRRRFPSARKREERQAVRAPLEPAPAQAA